MSSAEVSTITVSSPTEEHVSTVKPSELIKLKSEHTVLPTEHTFTLFKQLDDETITTIINTRTPEDMKFLIKMNQDFFNSFKQRQLNKFNPMKSYGFFKINGVVYYYLRKVRASSKRSHI